MKNKMSFGRYDYASFLTFICYAACSMIVPMTLVPLAADMNFPLESGGKGLGGALQLGRSIPMVLVMLLCGFFAGRWGKAKVLGIAMLFMGGGILLCSGASFYLLLFGALAIAGIGEGVVEGLATPFIQDQHEEDPGRYINFTHSFWSVGVVLTVLLVGYLLMEGVSWRRIIFFTGFLALLPACFFLLPDRKGRLKASREIRSTKEVARNTLQILKSSRFWLFFAAMFLAGGGEFCLTFWVASYIKLDYPGASLLHAGIGTASFAGGMILGRMLSGMLVKQEHLPHLIIGTALAAFLMSLGFPMIRSLGLLFVMLFLIGLAVAPFWPSIQSYATTRMTLDNTMLFVLLSCAGVPGCGFFSMLMGVAGDYFGLRISFYLATFCFFFMGLLILIDHLAALREKKSERLNAASRHGQTDSL